MRVQDQLCAGFQEAVIKHKAVIEFKDAIRDIINSEKKRIEDEYSIGVKIAEIFDKLFKQLHSAELEQTGTIIESVLGEQISENLLLGQVVDFPDFKESGGFRIVYRIKDGFNKEKCDPKQARIKLKLNESKNEQYVQSILSSIIVNFESYLATIFQILILKFPQRYFCGKTIPFVKIFDEDYEEYISSQVDGVVQDKMFDSLVTLTEIKEKSQIDIDRYIPIRMAFEEIYYRRNLFIHSNGVVNALYLGKVSPEYKKGVRIDDVLVCDDQYLTSALIQLKKILCTLYYEVLGVLDSTSDDYDVLFETGFNSLQSGEYQIAEHIFDILRRNNTIDFESRTTAFINYMIALKQQRKDISQCIDSFDVSAMTMKFRIAKECLLENYKVVFELLRETMTQEFPNGYKASMIRDWPIFIDFRKTVYYRQLIKSNEESFEEIEITKTDLSMSSDCVTETNLADQ